MDNEKLIQIVRKYKYLYDLNNKYCTDNQKKEEAWIEIGKKLQRSGRECKKAWALLRDAYRRSVKKRRVSESGMIKFPRKKWKYEDKMSFLLPHMKERNALCPISEAPPCKDDDKTYDEGDIADLLKVEVWEETDTSTPEVTQSDVTLSGTSQNYPQCITIGERTDISSNLLVKYLIDSTKDAPPPDDLELFMAGVMSTLRSFPPRDKVRAKSRIFEVVSQMELDIQSRPSTSK